MKTLIAYAPLIGLAAGLWLASMKVSLVWFFSILVGTTGVAWIGLRSIDKVDQMKPDQTRQKGP